MFFLRGRASQVLLERQFAVKMNVTNFLSKLCTQISVRETVYGTWTKHLAGASPSFCSQILILMDCSSRWPTHSQLRQTKDSVGRIYIAQNTYADSHYLPHNRLSRFFRPKCSALTASYCRWSRRFLRNTSFGNGCDDRCKTGTAFRVQKWFPLTSSINFKAPLKNIFSAWKSRGHESRYAPKLEVQTNGFVTFFAAF